MFANLKCVLAHAASTALVTQSLRMHFASLLAIHDLNNPHLTDSAMRRSPKRSEGAASTIREMTIVRRGPASLRARDIGLFNHCRLRGELSRESASHRHSCRSGIRGGSLLDKPLD